MLETVDLDLKLDKGEHHRLEEAADLRLGELQRQVRQAGIPVVVVFCGGGASLPVDLASRCLVIQDLPAVALAEAGKEVI